MDASWATVTIAAIVAIIAFLQWMTAREKILLDLFDKRFDIYQDLRSSISYQLQYARMDQENYFKFVRAVSRSKLLFGPEVFDFLEKRRIDLARTTLGFEPPTGVNEVERKRIEDDMVALMGRLGDFFVDLDRLVLPYMQHAQKRLDWTNFFASSSDTHGRTQGLLRD